MLHGLTDLHELSLLTLVLIVISSIGVNSVALWSCLFLLFILSLIFWLLNKIVFLLLDWLWERSAAVVFGKGGQLVVLLVAHGEGILLLGWGQGRQLLARAVLVGAHGSARPARALASPALVASGHGPQLAAFALRPLERVE